MPEADEHAEADLPVEEHEAIVIGSGFGGAVAACRLAQVGFDTIILERGRRYEANDFPALPLDEALLPDLRRWTWQHDQGLWDVQDLQELVAVQAAGYGGGSLIYANVHLRAPDSVFGDKWPKEYRKGELRKFYNLAAYMLEPAPITTHGKLVPLRKADGLKAAMKALGREASVFHPPLAIRNAKGRNRHEREMNACDGCGRCCTGCPIKAKNTLDFNYLAVAERFGAIVRTQCEVIRIAQLADDTWMVRAIDHLGAKQVRFHAPSLFLCAGSIHSTRLLAGAKLRRPESKRVQRRAGIGYFPGGDSLGVVFDTRNVQDPNVGPTIATTTVHWESKAEGKFFQIQDGGYGPQLDRLIGMLRAPLWVGRNRLTEAEKVRRNKPRKPPSGPPPAGVMPSPLDALLDVGAPNRCHDRQTGTTAEIVPEQLRASFSRFLDELKEPMLLPAVVGGVIDDALRALQKRWSVLVPIDVDGRFAKALRRIVRWAIRLVLASDEELAGFAIRRLASGGGVGRNEYPARLLGYDDSHSRYRTMLLGMGRDPAVGELLYDRKHDRVTANLDLYYLTPSYAQQERLMADVAGQLGGELRTNPAWEFVGKPITVHNQGGCPMSDKPADGVTDPDGNVHGCPGLYIMDGSVFCASVGVNPSATIAAIAERNIERFINREGGPKPKRPNTGGEAAYERDREESAKWDEDAERTHWALSPPVEAPIVPMVTPSLGIAFDEHMEGSYSRTSSVPVKDDDYRALESQGRPDNDLSVDLHVQTENLHRFFEDERHELDVTGSATILGEGLNLTESVSGTLQLFVARRKRVEARCPGPDRHDAQKRLARSTPALIGSSPYPEERLMTYSFGFESGRFQVMGYKRIRNDPGLDAWRDVSALHYLVFEAQPDGQYTTWGAGVVRVDFPGFVYSQLPSFKIIGTGPSASTGLRADDPRNVWALAKFASFFFGSLQRIYVPAVGPTLSTFFRVTPPTKRH